MGPSYNASFVLPLNNDEKRRDVFMGIQNLENNLDLQIIITCDSSLVKGYLLTGDVTLSEQTNFKLDTSKYSCGDKIRVQQNKGAIVVLI